ncbi:MAG: hypothetical protein U0269_19885 [Polyangiales bacterium]
MLDASQDGAPSDAVAVDSIAMDRSEPDVTRDAGLDAPSPLDARTLDGAPDDTINDTINDTIERDARTDAPLDVASDAGADVSADRALDVVRETGAECLAPLRMCGAACVELSSSAQHCGACNNPCAAGRVCSSGLCVCAPGTKLCGASCVADDNPATGCAGASCGACSVPNASARCSAGACAVGLCAAGFGDCNASAADGCETALGTSSTHCGACGNTCAGDSACVAGVCRPLNDRCAAATVLGTDPYNQTYSLSLRGATGEARDCSGAGGSSVYYRVNITRPALFYAMVQSNTIFTPTVGLSVDCSTRPLCQSGTCGDTRISQGYFQVNPGPVYIEVGRSSVGDGDFTLVVSAIPIPSRGSGASATGAITFELPGPSYNMLNMFDAMMPTAQTSCGGASPTPAFTLYWSSCPSAPGGRTLSMSTCSAERSFDTVLEYRDARGRTECNDDDTMTTACAPTGPGVGYGSTISAILAGGPNLHVVTLRQRSGAGLGTAMVRWSISER